MPGTPGSSHLQGPTSGSQMHHPDFHHPSPQHGHMGMAGMHSSPTKMHPAGGTQGHHGHQAGAPFHWSHGAEMPIPGAAGGSRGENMPLDSSGMHFTNRTASEYLTKNLDLRKALSTPKVFIESRFYLISNRNKIESQI